ncbi:MAG: chondroitinase, partial [Odoribacter sp.]|nr:chondroitinase [Odoribacter sp.]
MNTKRIIIFILWIFALLHFNRVYANDLERVKEHIKQSYLRVINDAPELRERIDEIGRLSGNPDIMIRKLSEGYNPELVKRYLNSIKEDGSWADINYDDNSRSGWQPSYHLERMMWMAKAYKDKNSEFYNNTELGEAIHKALAFWGKGNFVCRNWWYNQIGGPRMLTPVLILLEDEWSEEEKAIGIKYMENAKLGMTGQNSAWLAENVMVRALLEQNEELFLQARGDILKELKVAEKGEGIRPDMSFHQHGAQQQFGNYGLAYANTMAYWARIFEGTEYVLSEEQLSVLRGYILDGIRWTIWKRNMDISACGRQLFKYGQEGKALSVGKALKNMIAADPEYSEEY